jgi:peptide-methionine (S)-S-oxide reductase
MKRVALLLLILISTPALAAPRSETAVLAGGCFWGMEWVFEHVKGVTSVVSGYAGGRADDASYERVSSETTGHAEAVKISFDPSQLSFGKLLEIYFLVAHDPTQVNRQGPDIGSSYRSAIFPQNAAQEQFARSYMHKLGSAHIWSKPLATKVEHGAFFAAEKFHQHFAQNHQDYPYILINDRPKVHSLRRKFPGLYKG